MAKDVIARLRVEHQQWDEGMRRAKSGVDNLKKGTSGMEALMGGAIKKVGAMAAAWASVEVAGKAFNKLIAGSQTLTDEWGRTMQASTRVLDGFFESLAQGSFQSFLGGLDDMIAKAREAYDAIDALGTYDIFSGPLKAKYEYEITKLKYEIRAGVGNADEKKAEIRTIEEKMLTLSNKESTLSGSAASKLLASFTNSKGGIDMLEELFKSGDQAQNVALAKYEELKNKYSHTEEYDKVVGTTAWGGTIMGKGESTVWVNDEIREQAETLKAFGELGDEKLQEVAKLFIRQYRAGAEVYAKKMENLETLRYNGPGGGGGNKTFSVQKFEQPKLLESLDMGITTSMAELKRMLSEAQSDLLDATTSQAMDAANAMIAELTARIEAQPIALRLNVPESEIVRVQSLISDMSEKIRNDITPIEITDMAGGQEAKPLKSVEDQIKAIQGGLNKTTDAFGTMGAAMQMLDDPAAKVAGIVMQAIANVAASFAQALNGARDPWSWIAAAIAGTATMISTVAAIKSVTAGTYAEGGVITGGPHTGDAIPIMANAGEIILNASQQQAVASQLQPRESENRVSYVTGENILLGLNNHLRRTGRGEIITSRSR